MHEEKFSEETKPKQDPFTFDLENLHADAVEMVNHPLAQAAILRVKHGKTEQGFNHRYDRAYHSHSST